VGKKRSPGLRSRKKHSLPRGIRIFLLYSLCLAFIHLMLFFLSDTGLFFGMMLTGGIVKALNLGFFLLISLMIFGFLRRDMRMYYLAIGLYSISIVSSIVSLLSKIFVPAGFITAIYLTIVINSITLWYLITIRSYFYLKRVNKKHEKVFVYSIYSVSAIFLIIIGLSSLNFALKLTKSIDQIMEKINGQSFTESLFYCEDSKSKDLCYVALVVKNENDDSMSRLCRRIESSFYRFTCERVIQ